MRSSNARLSARPPADAPVYFPIRTTTSPCVGMMVALCPPAPLILKALSGIGCPPLALTQKNEPPYWSLPSVTQAGAVSEA